MPGGTFRIPRRGKDRYRRRRGSQAKVYRSASGVDEGFKNEVDIVKARMRASRATILARPNRALYVARRSGRVAKLRIFDQVQADRLVRFGKYGRYFGNGLAVIDFGSRVDNIHDSYKAGDDWCREMFIESSSFAVSAGAGMFVVNVGSALMAKVALTTFVAATPAGWALIVVDIGVAAAAATTSILLDKTIKEDAGGWYDSIMKWTNAK